MAVPGAAANRRTSFGRVMLIGLASAGLMAVASSQTWLNATGDNGGVTQKVAVSGADSAPLALALALVALAGWGVILVSATVARRVAAGISLVAVVGALGVVVQVLSDSQHVAAQVLADHGTSDIGIVSHGPWYWVTALAGLVELAALVTAYRAAPTWPTMSSRYDAPGERLDPARTASAGEPLADLAFWKALDEGRDPTDPAAP